MWSENAVPEPRSLAIPLLDARQPEFVAQLAALRASGHEDLGRIHAQVGAILEAVRSRGDEALLEYSRSIDGLEVATAEALEVPSRRMQEALLSIAADLRTALETAASRIRAYHEHQRLDSWSCTEQDGTRMGMLIRPLERVGVYAPGGRASYPSTVLMNVLPARLAGVEEVILSCPAPGGRLSEAVLAAAAIAGVDRMFMLGGAQAVAAMAYGTQTIARVDKVVGPGNAYVAEAKRQLSGQVGVDMIAGPSEVLLICDGSVDPRWVAWDLLSQAEHDEQAQALLLSPERSYIEAVRRQMEMHLPDLPRQEVIRSSLQHRGALIQVADLEQALEIANHIAPEHLVLALAQPRPWLERVRNAGAVFLGAHSSEVLGDYCAGPNHVLPTMGTARFSSPLGIHDFLKRTTWLECSAAGADTMGRIAARLAQAEGLDAHAHAARCRIMGAGSQERS